MLRSLVGSEMCIRDRYKTGAVSSKAETYIKLKRACAHARVYSVSCKLLNLFIPNIRTLKYPINLYQSSMNAAKRAPALNTPESLNIIATTKHNCTFQISNIFDRKAFPRIKYNCTFQISNIFDRKALPRKTKNKETQKLNSKTFILCIFELLMVILVCTYIANHTPVKRAPAQYTP